MSKVQIDVQHHLMPARPARLVHTATVTNPTPGHWTVFAVGALLDELKAAGVPGSAALEVAPLEAYANWEEVVSDG